MRLLLSKVFGVKVRGSFDDHCADVSQDQLDPGEEHVELGQSGEIARPHRFFEIDQRSLHSSRSARTCAKMSSALRRTAALPKASAIEPRAWGRVGLMTSSAVPARRAAGHPE